MEEMEKNGEKIPKGDEMVLFQKLNISQDALDWRDCRKISQMSSELIDKLSHYIYDEKWTLLIASNFPQLLPSILHSSASQLIAHNEKLAHLFKTTVGLSRLVGNYPTALRHAEWFYSENESHCPFNCLPNSFTKSPFSKEPLKKRAKKEHDKNEVQNSILLLESVLILLKILPKQVTKLWPLSTLLQLLNNNISHKISWLTIECIGEFLSISEMDLSRFISKYRIEGEIEFTLEFNLKYEKSAALHLITSSHQNSLQILLPQNRILKLSSGLLTIGPTLFFTQPSQTPQKSILKPIENNSNLNLNLVPLNSTLTTLRSLSLSLDKNIPICVIGPSGSGKSGLLGQLGYLNGRSHWPSIVRVQMSESIDSKLLLGSYHSTELPGKFVWKPGPLTTAVVRGEWVVLEDVDFSPGDVLSLVDGIFSTRKLTVSGYGEIQNIHPDFRLFATIRSDTGRRSVKLEKHWEKIHIETIGNNELKELLSHQFKHLLTVHEKLLGIFSDVKNFQDENVRVSGRHVTLRDFLKFLRRIPLDLDLTESHAAIIIFQEATDTFVAPLSSPGLRQELSEIIGTHLNLLKAKAEYFCSNHKPQVYLCPNSNILTVGRFTLPLLKPKLQSHLKKEKDVFSLTRRSCSLLENLSGCIVSNEPILLIGETGVGKTSCVQHLAQLLNQTLIVINLNRQTDSGDLLGGYRPVELQYILSPLRDEFEYLFSATFSREANSKFLGHIMTCFANKRWADLTQLMSHVKNSAISKLKNSSSTKQTQLQRWVDFGVELKRVEMQIGAGEESPFAFSFVEGTLVTAIRKGYWILLDEINLATPEMLQCLSGVLDESPQLHLWEKGDSDPLLPHPHFHLFAAMNPSTDVGKKDLPLGLRNRFTEFYVDELVDPLQLHVLVSDYLSSLLLPSSQIDSIVEFYLKIRELSEDKLVDGTGRRPLFSLRTLCRALRISSLNLYGSVKRSLYESFCLSFLTQLDSRSHPLVSSLISQFILGKVGVKAIISQSLPPPPHGKFIQIEGYWVPQGELEPHSPPSYILTPSIRRNLKDLTRIVSAGKLPILLQGETSVGKTSLINYLANLTGNRCYRINNHQHTDLQEYVGSYQSDSSGRLVFSEGILVRAMRKGEWVILDELNLAPSEVLEALNRLLDDNRQLFIPETGDLVTAHPRFNLFATQNPPGLYAGRNLLSRAFRNRFIELHFDEIPTSELETILHLRCSIPESYSKKIIGVLRELQMRRRGSAALEGKGGFGTLRDLFRWAERYRRSSSGTTKFYDWEQHLADEGYLVLGGKVRKEEEAEYIREVLQKHLKRTVNPHNLFSLHEKTSSVTRELLEELVNFKSPTFSHIVWTFDMRRLGVLIASSVKFQEPILLVGETGGGKTTIVQLLAELYKTELYPINCHMHSEGSDFLGGLRPTRNKNESGSLFEWVDGPLVLAMESGGLFLADEISLADDSVLERLNSVLEPERTLLLAEKGDEEGRVIQAHPGFSFIGTMNPGGDYGKKELSPALRNRLTEIWATVPTSPSDLISIIEHNLVHSVQNLNIGLILVQFVNWLTKSGNRVVVSVRDYLSWTSFINKTVGEGGSKLGVGEGILHGGALVFIDGLGSKMSSIQNAPGGEDECKKASLAHLVSLISTHLPPSIMTQSLSYSLDRKVEETESCLTIGPFSVHKSNNLDKRTEFSLDAPTTSLNALRVVRGMELDKPILLEGSPGVGKTALVGALAKLTGNKVTRINFSEQTDISDLFGADLPVEGGSGGEFSWRDGPLLEALKNSSWILLDELNLASQSVLEGLNACLDHRAEIYVPPLNKTFKIHTNTSNNLNKCRIFACQNPLREGGARKGLPKSFLNRFTQVFMDPLSEEDLNLILNYLFGFDQNIIKIMGAFGDGVGRVVGQGAKGGPWDFNLRDLCRWAQVLERKNLVNEPGFFVDFIYGRRMRSREDSQKILEFFTQISQKYSQNPANGEEKDPTIRNNQNNILPIENSFKILKCGESEIEIDENSLRCGNGVLVRNKNNYGGEISNLVVLQRQLAAFEALVLALEMGWMPILVGPTGGGKSSLVKLVSQLTGNELKIMTVSPEMDTIELLGGFEQADVWRRVDECEKELLKEVEILLKNSLCHSHSNYQILVDSWSGLSRASLKSTRLESERRRGSSEEINELNSRISFLKKSLKDLSLFTNNFNTNEELETKINHLKSEVNKAEEEIKSGCGSGAFQWIDSVLVNCLKNGEWLCIEGANSCSPAVLDRLNSVLEPGGSLLLSERGSFGQSGILQITPHPNFRLILTYDPTAHPDISRAMRNRGLEIYVPGPQEISFYPSNQNKTESEMVCKIESNYLDVMRLLKGKGVNSSHLRTLLFKIHEKIKDSLSTNYGEGLDTNILMSVVSYFALEIQHGSCIETGLLNSIYRAYFGSKSNFILNSDEVDNIKTSIEKFISFSLSQKELNIQHLYSSRLPLSLPNFQTAQMYRIWRAGEILEICTSDEIFTNFKKSFNSQQLLNQLLILTTTQRLPSSDSLLFSKLISSRTSQNDSTFIQKLQKTLNSQLFLTNSYDRQHFPYFMAQISEKIGKKCLKNNELVEFGHILLRSLSLHKVLFEKSVNFNKGTLGYLSKNIFEGKFSSQNSNEMSKNIWVIHAKIFEYFEKVLENCDIFKSVTYGEISNIWLQGVRSFIFGEFLGELCSVTYDPKRKNENFEAECELVLEWTLENVSTFFNYFGKNEIVNLFTTVLHKSNSEVEKLERVGDEFRKILNVTPFLVSIQNYKNVEEIFEILSTIWSLKSRVEKESLAQFFSPNNSTAIKFHSTLSCLLPKVFEKSYSFTQDELDVLIDLRKELNFLLSQHESPTEPNDEKCKKYQNFNYLSHLPPLLHFSSSLPLLKSPLHFPHFSLSKFMSWENEQRAKIMFLPSELYNILPQFYPLFSLTASQILCDEQKYRVGNLGNNKNRHLALGEIRKISTKKCFKEPDSEVEVLKNLKNELWIEIESFKSSGVVCEGLGEDLRVENYEVFEEMMSVVGKTMLEFGVGLMEKSSHLASIDPALKNKIQLKYLQKQADFFKCWLGAQEMYNISSTGNTYEKTCNSVHIFKSHPFVSISTSNLNSLNTGVEKCEKLDGTRPSPPKYSSLRTQITNFNDNFCGGRSKILHLIKFMRNEVEYFKNGQILREEEGRCLVGTCKIWIEAHREFVCEIFKEFWYWDIILPFISSSIYAVNGLSLIVLTLTRIYEKVEFEKKREKIEILVQFPIPYDSSLQSLQYTQKITKRCLMWSLMTFVNEFETGGHLDLSNIKKIRALSNYFLKLWKIEQNKREEKEASEEAFYIYKGAERKKELSDEQEISLQISTFFPTYSHEIQDLDPKNQYNLEQEIRNEIIENGDGERDDFLTKEDVAVFIKVHERVMKRVQNHWIYEKKIGKENEVTDFVTPYLHKFEESCGEILSSFESQNVEVEGKFILGSTLVVDKLQKFYEMSDFFRPVQIYDFYHDSNVEEVLKLCPILNGLIKRTHELLEQWADHPALLRILEIVRRLESFPTDGPLMKFLTCLELLLGTAQEWESCAHSGVSLSIHLGEITEIIISWRRLELQCWKNLLQITYEREVMEGHKWWFYLYSSSIELLKSSTSDTEKSSNFLKTLHKFVECAPLSQFFSRLQYMYTLHAYFAVLRQSGEKVPDFLISYLYNTHGFYCQFGESVRKKLGEMRGPIEKKMKDFVKISRWNDANFYALKDSVLKSQKTLIKLVREWKKCLNTPVSSVLVADLGPSLLSLDSNKITKTFVLHEKNYIISKNLIESISTNPSQNYAYISIKRLKNMRKLVERTRRVCKRVLGRDRDKFCGEINSIEELSASIISTAHELAGLEAPNLSGDKRKKALHNIHFRKRSSLANLFQALHSLSLSYRKGLIDYASTSQLHSHFATPPTNLTNAWAIFNQSGSSILSNNQSEASVLSNNQSESSNANISQSESYWEDVVSCDSELLSSWTGCESYFYKSISRLSLMDKSFESPSKELGINIITRCRGFSFDLLSTANKQKENISKFSNELWTLRRMTETNYGEGEVEGKFQLIFNATSHIEYDTKQILLIVESLDDSVETARNKLASSLLTILTLCSEIKSSLLPIVSSPPIPRLKVRKFPPQTLQPCICKLEKILGIFRSLSNSSLISSLAFSPTMGKIDEFLQIAQNQILDICPVLSAQDTGNENIQVFKRTVEKVVESCLLTFQKLEKLKEKRSKNNEENENGDENEILNLKEILNEELSCFNLNGVIGKVCSLVRIMRREGCGEYFEIFRDLRVVLKQYVILAQFYLTLYTRFFRSSSKLLSVISGLFATLASKGFCLPSDYEEEAAEEGVEMDAASGMGLGEGETGEGAKDVSDRLESEDQLEGAFKEGCEEGESGDKDLNDDEKGVEMSDDFDGKQQDVDKKNNDENNDGSDDESGDENEDLDKEMGDIQDPDAQKLDEKMWGGSSDEEDSGDEETKDEESGKEGANPQSELRAKDPSLQKQKNTEEEEEEEQGENEEGKTKEINEMDEDEEKDDNQMDPYHTNDDFSKEQDEIEEFELPQDLNLDEGMNEKNNEEGNEEENPFDLDKSEKMDKVPEEEEEKNEEMEEDENKVSDDEDEEAGKGVDVEKPQFEDDEGHTQNETKDEEISKIEEEEKEENSKEEDDENAKDEKEGVVELPSQNEDKSCDDDRAEPSDEVSSSHDPNVPNVEKDVKSDKTNENEVVDETVDDKNKNDENGTGSAESRDGGGHEGKDLKEDKNNKTIKEQDSGPVSRKPGEREGERSLAPDSSHTPHRLQTLDSLAENGQHGEDGEEDEEEESEKSGELFQHVRESEKSDGRTIDNSSKEEAERQRERMSELEESERNREEEEMEVQENEETNIEQESFDSSNPPPNSKEERAKNNVKRGEDERMMEVEVDVEGETVLTSGSQRPAISTFTTQIELLEEFEKEKNINIRTERLEYERDLQNNTTWQHEKEWNELESKTGDLAQELCEQLRLILEPTQAARLKGDYKTGKRLNMRKVIPYIASGFRKDKIWLRRTQPSKRDYQILLALDDSASMSDNHSKQMAFSALAVLGRSLSLLESGQLGVIRFGESASLVHSFEDSFSPSTPSSLLSKFTFSQRSTRISPLLSLASALFTQAQEGRRGDSAQLLLVVSDGRGISHEGAGVVRRAVKEAREQRVFIVFIVVDNPENKDSILDIRLPIFKPDGTLEICKYMDHFPFPFYLILRDLGALPSVLSDALRQWFELVASSER